jgi:hypothetical protein
MQGNSAEFSDLVQNMYDLVTYFGVVSLISDVFRTSACESAFFTTGTLRVYQVIVRYAQKLAAYLCTFQKLVPTEHI